MTGTPIVTTPGSARVWIRWRPWGGGEMRRTWDAGAWCWWCPCCRGGSWEITQPAAVAEALRHVGEQHR